MVKWAVGSNMPGYLPDTEPYITDDYQNGLCALLEDIVAQDFLTEDESLVSEDAKQAIREIERILEYPEVHEERDMDFHIDNYVYFIQVAE